MTFFADHNVYVAKVRFLRDLGHDVVTAAERSMSRLPDADLLLSAVADGRLLLTRDRDYGELVFQKAMGAGVIYLRIPPPVVQAVHAELGRVLGLYDPAELRGVFVVVEPGRHRIRRPPTASDS